MKITAALCLHLLLDAAGSGMLVVFPARHCAGSKSCCELLLLLALPSPVAACSGLRLAV
jgi:hypothetical protein